MAYAIGKKLGFSPSEVKWVTEPFDSSYAPGPKSFDFDINEISITKPREKAVDFSAPYYTNPQVGSSLRLTCYHALVAEAVGDPQVGDDHARTAVDQVIKPTSQPAAQIGGTPCPHVPRAATSWGGAAHARARRLTPCISVAVNALQSDGTLAALTNKRWIASAAKRAGAALSSQLTRVGTAEEERAPTSPPSRTAPAWRWARAAPPPWTPRSSSSPVGGGLVDPPQPAGAALALGLTPTQSLHYVVVPQAVRRVIPPLMNDFLAWVKDVALVSIIGPQEAFRVAQIYASLNTQSRLLLASTALYPCVTGDTLQLDEQQARIGRRASWPPSGCDDPRPRAARP